MALAGTTALPDPVYINGVATPLASVVSAAALTAGMDEDTWNAQPPTAIDAAVVSEYAKLVAPSPVGGPVTAAPPSPGVVDTIETSISNVASAIGAAVTGAFQGAETAVASVVDPVAIDIENTTSALASGVEQAIQSIVSAPTKVFAIRSTPVNNGFSQAVVVTLDSADGSGQRQVTLSLDLPVDLATLAAAVAAAG